MSASSLPVELLFRIEYETPDAPAVVGNGPHGNRLVLGASAGTFSGPRLRGTVVPPGGDWVTMGADGSVRIDVRALLRTDDGVNILMTYTGVGVPGEGGLALRTAPRFETGHADYAWLNQVQAVGIGELGGAGVVYDVYRLL